MRVLPLAVAAFLALAAAALAHPGAPVTPDSFYKWGEQNSPTFSAAMKNVPDPGMQEGPCTKVAARSMPAGEGHDHTAVEQHRFACNMEQTSFHPLLTELEDRPDVVLGEMDVKGDLAVVATAYPESGFLLFDVKDPAKPKFLSWYRGDECEGTFADVDCGAFVDLSPDGKRVYISVQQITVIGGGLPQLGVLPAAYPGVDVVDISDPEAPLLKQKLPVVSVGGVHTTRSFEVPGDGEYTVSVANGVGAAIHKLEGGVLVPVTTIEMDELHDTFIQQDPLTKKTLLYIAGGFDSGFYVYDVTDPSSPVGLGEWDPTPECENDWYAHTIDVTTVNGRRIVTMPVELIDFFGDQSAADQAQGCGKLQGNGDFAGPLFIVDATDFSKLGEPQPVDDEPDEEASDMKKRSEATLITTWSNAAKRAGGRLVFSPHNQQIVGDHIYLSGYHSGVTVLDASEAFRGRNVRPSEVGVMVPTGSPTRPIHPDRATSSPAFDQFFTSFIKYRPTVWDMQWHRGSVLVADMTGGFHALRYTPGREDHRAKAPAPAVAAPAAQAPSAAAPAPAAKPKAKKAKKRTCRKAAKKKAKSKRSKRTRARSSAKPRKCLPAKKRKAAKRKRARRRT
jgi:hypothetical protein